VESISVNSSSLSLSLSLLLLSHLFSSSWTSAKIKIYMLTFLFSYRPEVAQRLKVGGLFWVPRKLGATKAKGERKTKKKPSA